MRQPYPSDLSEVRWELLSDLFPAAAVGRPREVNLRDVVDAICYVNRTGVPWRYRPHDLPRWDVVYSYFRKWTNAGTWDDVQRFLREEVRQAAGREATPRLGCVDSQRVKGTECGGEHGIDGHKKIKGVKRPIWVDTLGFLLAVQVTAAAVTDAPAARAVFRRAAAEGSPRLVKVLGDPVYGNEGLPKWTKENTTFRLEITVKAPTPSEPGKKKFKVIQWRWVVERSLAWLGRYRRNRRDYEKLPQSSESMRKISGIQRMVRRLRPKQDSFVFHYPKNQEKQAK